MAEAASIVVDLCKCFGAEVGHATNMEDKLKKLSDQVGELKSLKKDVQKEVDDATKADREPTEMAKHWLKKADSIIHHADSAMEKVEKKKKEREQEDVGGCCCAHGWSLYKLGKRIAKVTKEVDRHEGKGKELKILRDDRVSPAASKEKDTQHAAGESEYTVPVSGSGGVEANSADPAARKEEAAQHAAVGREEKAAVAASP